MLKARGGAWEFAAMAMQIHENAIAPFLVDGVQSVFESLQMFHGNSVPCGSGGHVGDTALRINGMNGRRTAKT